MTHSERGSATLHTLFAVVLLFTALTAAILWSAISTARHKLAGAADLTALSAAQAVSATRPMDLNAPTSHPSPADQPNRPVRPASVTPPVAPCATAARVAALNKVDLTSCTVSLDVVTVEVSLRLDLRLSRPTLTAAARAGPV